MTDTKDKSLSEQEQRKRDTEGRPVYTGRDEEKRQQIGRASCRERV